MCGVLATSDAPPAHGERSWERKEKNRIIATEKPGNRMAPGLVLFLYSVSLIIPYRPVFCVVHSGMSPEKFVKNLALYSHFHKLKFENPLPACV